MSPRLRAATIQVAVIVLVCAAFCGAQVYFDTVAVATAVWRVASIAAFGALVVGYAWLTDEQASAAQIARKTIERARRK